MNALKDGALCRSFSLLACLLGIGFYVTPCAHAQSNVIETTYYREYKDTFVWRFTWDGAYSTTFVPTPTPDLKDDPQTSANVLWKSSIDLNINEGGKIFCRHHVAAHLTDVPLGDPFFFAPPKQMSLGDITYPTHQTGDDVFRLLARASVKHLGNPEHADEYTLHYSRWEGNQIRLFQLTGKHNITAVPEPGLSLWVFSGACIAFLLRQRQKAAHE